MGVGAAVQLGAFSRFSGMSRFYAPKVSWSGGRVCLDEFEGRHASEVLRLRVGDKICIFDGEGRVAEGRLLSASKKRVEAEVVSEQHEAAPRGRTTLVQAIPKGKLFEWILEKATELGAVRIVPLLTERTVVQLDGAERERKREKWQRAVVEACKQCGQNWLPLVDEPVALAAFLRTPAASDALVASLHPGAVPLREAFSGVSAGDVSVFVGPEGDFSPQEMEWIVGWGARPVSLGRIVLRVETAAMYCLSVLASHRQS